jgi:predicted HTH domain antitoxin
MSSVTLKLPDLILNNHGRDERRIQNRLIEAIVVMDYLAGRISIREASDVLNIKYRDFLNLLWDSGINIDAMPEEEIERQADTLENLLT